MTTLLLSASQRAQIEREARAASPRECCGLLEGVREGDAIRIAALHPARNLSSDKDRFEIAPADHFAALRAARANGRAIVGCYHSHPNGKSEPSARDAEGAWDEGFVWLIAATHDSAVSLAGFARRQDGWQTLDMPEIAEKAA
ncbi:MAG: M67 family metallopeptidase [Proteobacteria bacterium]|nr:M67 family metallopeptidase [Pseudomonadota bacterium]